MHIFQTKFQTSFFLSTGSNLIYVLAIFGISRSTSDVINTKFWSFSIITIELTWGYNFQKFQTRPWEYFPSSPLLITSSSWIYVYNFQMFAIVSDEINIIFENFQTWEFFLQCAFAILFSIIRLTIRFNNMHLRIIFPMRSICAYESKGFARLIKFKTKYFSLRFFLNFSTRPINIE